MLNGFKLTAICVTKLQDEFCSKFLQSLHREAIGTNHRLLVFNSFVDFFKDGRYEQGAKAAYNIINLDVIDSLVIIDHCFYDKELVSDLIRKAKEKNIPVLVLYGDYEGCFSIQKDYKDTFYELISHVICKHNAKKLRFVAGNKGDANSDARLEIFLSALKDHCLDIPEDAFAYCNFWHGPVYNAVDKWLSEDTPDAIICANDSMAYMVCERLAKHGLSVPKDMIVTGFDGLESLSFRKPKLTTCAEDIPAAASLCMKLILSAESGAEPYTALEKFSVVISESCGCTSLPDANYRDSADRLYRTIEEIRSHEARIYAWAERIHDSTDLSIIGKNLSENILRDSAVAVSSNFLAAARKYELTDPDKPFTEKMVAISRRGSHAEQLGQEVFELKEMYPGLLNNIAEEKMTVFQSIYSADEVCGYYAARTEDITEICDRLHRLSRITSLEFSVILSHIKQEHMSSSIEKIRTRNALTGLINLKGLIAQINDNYESYSNNSIVVSVYAIPRYKYIIENFGLEDAEEAVTLTADALQLANSEGALVAHISEDEFVIVNLINDPALVGETVNHATSAFFKIIEEYNTNRGKDYFVEVNCGCVVSRPGWENDILSFIKAANGEMYLNRLKTGSTPALKKEKSKEEYYRLFDLLIEKNLFIYHFQPIVSTVTGEIYAYEALMRTDSAIGLNPGQILGVAEEYMRLYDIERATLFNVMDFIDRHTDDFKGKRVFINTIPGCFLNKEDYKILVEKYGHLFSFCTIEITEQNETNDAELMQIKRLESNGTACQLAIDDYGTGFSNIVNLLRYQPQVIKIDRYLITDVHKDTNKQLFIGSTVEFARLNNILVLAEGVETKEELDKVIELGADLIQGFYTAKPSAEVIQKIDQSIAGFIVRCHKKYFGKKSETSIYEPEEGDIVDITDSFVNECTRIRLNGGKYTIVGNKDIRINVPVETAPDTNNTIVFDNVNIGALVPSVILGDNSVNTVIIRGSCRFENEGIRVPESASLILNGSGDLLIRSNRNTGTSIGGGINDNCGGITVDMEGSLTVDAAGENPVCIGGSRISKPVCINRGKLLLEAKGKKSIGIGCTSEKADIRIADNVELKILSVGNNAVGIGSLEGKADIYSQGNINIETEGAKTVGMGVLNGGSGSLTVADGSLDVTIHGTDSVCVGSINGSMSISVTDGRIDNYIEGGRACCIGNYSGSGNINISGGTVHTEIHSSYPVCLGSNGDRTVITGGNILTDMTADNAINAFGEPLRPTEIPDENSFERLITSENGSYTYKAARLPEDDKLIVYLPF